MSTGLSRREHYALLGLIALLLGGWGLNMYRARQAASVYIEGQGSWEKVADFEAIPRDNLTSATLMIPPEILQSARAAGTALNGLGLNINTATLEDLEQLPGIGPVRAQAILDERDKRGGFRSLNELLEVNGIGSATLERLRPYLRLIEADETATTSSASQATKSTAIASTALKVMSANEPVTTVNINSAGIDELKTIKGVGDVLASRIVEDRSANGPFRRPEDLKRIKGIGDKSFEKMRPKVSVQ